jgi:amidase
VPVEVQVIAGRLREDVCLALAEVIDAHAPPQAPIDA